MSQAGQFYRSGLLLSLTGDIGGAIVPVAGNIDILGGPGVTVTGTAGTLTISMAGASDSFITDAGTAVPDALGDLNILGGSNLNTTGVGSTVTVIMDNDVTLSGQLEANEVESITYITAGTNITSTAGNISAVAGNITAGGAITAVGDITTTTGDLNATIGGLNLGGAIIVAGDITSSAGSIIAQVNLQAVTGDVIASAGAGSFNTTVTAGTDIISTAGNISTVAGNITSSGTVTGTTGLIATAGGVLASAGDITATLGDIVTSAGSIDSASTISAVNNITSSAGDVVTTTGAGDFATTVTAGGNITSTAGDLIVSAGTITASSHIISSTGNVITTAGEINSGSTASAVGNITSSTGDLVSTLGDIRAPNGTLYVSGLSVTGDITAGNDLVAINDVIAGNIVSAGNGVSVTTGGILVLGGDILAVTGSITAQANMVALTGDIGAPLGDITAGFDVVANADISSVMGDITAEMGDVLARYDVEAVEGDIIAHAGDIYTVAGFIRSAGAVIADVNLKASGTVQFTDITDGGLLVDADGFVSSSTGFTAGWSGFATWTGAGNYFDDTVLGSFEVLRGGTGFIKGIPVAWAGGQTVTGMTAGNSYLIYMDDTGTIGKTTTYSRTTFHDYIILFECLRDSTAGTNIQYTVKENHTYDYPVESSYYAHEVIGTVIENNEQGANITLNGTQKIEIVGADELADHGLYTDIIDSGGVAETWMQMLTNGAGKWITYQSSDTFNGYWNSAGTATAPSGNKFSIYTLYVSKDTITVATPTYWAVLDDQEYNNLAAAQAALIAGTNAIATNELAFLEFAQLGQIIYQQSINTITFVNIAKDTLRSTVSGGGGSSTAALTSTNVTNFDGILGAGDTNVQVSLETIDDWGAATTDHAVLLGQGVGTPIASTAVGTNGQLVIGSTGADPVFANVISTDSSITITEGAGTLDIEIAAPIGVPSGGTGLTTITDHGVMVGSGVGAVTPLAVGTNGQVIVGSTGADPVFATISSTDSSITITEGAGTLALTGTQSTVTQLGSVELATDAEAIAGTDTDRPIVPSSLAAKLGTQTDHGALIGSGTAGAITALGVAANGQLIVGSTGADPVIVSLASTDGSLTVTEGAGTLVVEGTDATETQDGVVELATDAEALAGTDTVRAIVPTSLKAKLGAQTDHGVLVGSGTTAAVTALAVGTNGQVLVGSTGADPVFATVASADSSIEFTLGAGTLDLSASGILTIVAETGTTYELLLTDVGKLVTCSNAGAIDLTVPVNADVAIPVGSQILVTQLGAGVVTLVPEGGVTLSSNGALLDTNGQYATVALIKVATNIWLVSGDLA